MSNNFYTAFGTYVKIKYYENTYGEKINDYFTPLEI